MRKRILFLTVILGLLLGAPAAWAQPDTLDLPILEDGETISAAFDTNADAQLYAFNGSEGDEVTILMEKTDNTDLDPLLMLLDEVGQVIATADDISRTNRSAEIEDAELPADGTYFVVAMTYIGLAGTDDSDDSDAPYGYDLTASGFNTPEGRDVDTLRYAGIVATYGDPVQLAISREAPVFYVSFDGEEGEEVDIMTYLSGDDDDVQDTLLYLFAPDGRRIAVNDDPQRGELAAQLEDIELPQDGRYIIFASSFYFHDIVFLEQEGLVWFDGGFELEVSN
jgi:hypothetical protein